MRNKKGESLVEVVVALGIFAFVFMGVVNIIAGSVTLNLSSKQREETVAKVQGNLNRYLAGNTNTGACVITARSAGVYTSLNDGNAGCEVAGALTNSNDICFWLELKTLDSSGTKPETNNDYGLTNPNFIKVVSHGKWYTRILGEQEFTLSRILRNN